MVKRPKVSKYYENDCRLLFHQKLFINRLLTSAFVLVNGIVFNRSNGLIIRCLIAFLMSYFTRNNRFQEPFNVKYLKEIKRLKSLQVKAVSYLEPKQAS